MLCFRTEKERERDSNAICWYNDSLKAFAFKCYNVNIKNVNITLGSQILSLNAEFYSYNFLSLDWELSSQFSDRRLVEKLALGDSRAVRSAKGGEKTSG